MFFVVFVLIVCGAGVGPANVVLRNISIVNDVAAYTFSGLSRTFWAVFRGLSPLGFKERPKITALGYGLRVFNQFL